ncbi:hypothetical protein GCM10018780_59290 [Streptomyces lanatus]|nr:hypothetical protein GCM10018780_59290 [Streptomyces lanatus]
MGFVVAVVGIVGLGAVIGAVVVFAVVRSRRNFGTGPISSGVGAHPQNMGYLPQQPYLETPNQGYTTLPGNPPQHPNPYAQQPPPYQGQ